MNIGGLEFEFAGEAVGFFVDAISPDSDGLFRYEPYRGNGHWLMHQQLRQSGSARCSYVDAGRKVSFVVIACPEYGVLNLSSFSVQHQIPRST